jgi:negative regulator of sigma E activity
MKKIITFGVGTIALVGAAIGVQAFATTSHEEDKRPPAVTQTTPANGSTSSPSEGAAKEDDGQRDGFTEDHAGKPGETK